MEQFADDRVNAIARPGNVAADHEAARSAIVAWVKLSTERTEVRAVVGEKFRLDYLEVLLCPYEAVIDLKKGITHHEGCTSSTPASRAWGSHTTPKRAKISWNSVRFGPR